MYIVADPTYCNQSFGEMQHPPQVFHGGDELLPSAPQTISTYVLTYVGTYKCYAGRENTVFPTRKKNNLACTLSGSTPSQPFSCAKSSRAAMTSRTPCLACETKLCRTVLSFHMLLVSLQAEGQRIGSGGAHDATKKKNARNLQRSILFPCYCIPIDTFVFATCCSGSFTFATVHPTPVPPSVSTVVPFGLLLVVELQKLLYGASTTLFRNLGELALSWRSLRRR